MNILNMIKYTLIFMGSLFLLSCNELALDVTHHDDAPIIFLRDKPKGEIYVFPEALFVAKLTIVNGCVQLVQNDKNAKPVTPSWPDYAKLMKMGDGYYIKIKNKRLNFGQTYHFGGGGYAVTPDMPMTKVCGSTYQWFVGDVRLAQAASNEINTKTARYDIVEA